MKLQLVLVAFSASVALADLLGDIAARDNTFGELYNNQDFHRLVHNMYADSAVLVPPTVDVFIPKGGLVAFFQDAYNEGIRDVVLTPSVVHGTPDNTTVHELGTVSSSAVNGPYYIRWVRESHTWKIETDVMALRHPEILALRASVGKSPIVTSRRMPSGDHNAQDFHNARLVARKDARFNEAYNAQNFQAVQDIYAESGLLVPPSQDAFVPQADLATLFDGLYNGDHAGRPSIHDLALTPFLTRATDDGNAIHELGMLTSTTAAGPYYVRWAKQTDGSWKIDTDITSIGTGLAPGMLLAAKGAAPWTPTLAIAIASAALSSAVLASLLGVAAMRAAGQRATEISERAQSDGSIRPASYRLLEA